MTFTLRCENPDCVLNIYDITEYETFTYVKNTHQQGRLLTYLVGNKLDMIE